MKNQINSFIRYILLIIFCLGLSESLLFAQKIKTNKKQRKPESVIEKDTFRYQKLPYDTVKYEKGDLIELLSGASYGEVIGGDSLVRVIGRNITFKQGNRFIFCDSAYFYPRKNFVKAMGNVQIAEEGASTISAKTMDFDANSGTLMARGDANFTKDQTNLRAPAIDYNINSKIAYYFGNGTMTDGKNQLSSESGSYDTGTKNLFARKNVKAKGATDDGQSYEIASDTLQYNDGSKLMNWKGKNAKITTSDGVIESDEGEFNTKTKKSKLKGKKNVVENAEYRFKGDILDYDQVQKSGYAKGNAEIFSKKDNILINAQEGKFNGKQGISRFYGGRAYMRMIDEDKDTLWVVADTLVSVGSRMRDKNEKQTKEDSLREAKEPKMLFAYHNAKIYKSDLQGICDSLVYNMKDSVVRFYKEPVMWNAGNQVSADSLDILNKNNKPHKILLRENAFVISKDSVGNYNQMKGKYIDALLKDGKMDKVFVTGNAETIYFQLKEDKSLIGMYKIICGSVKAEFELGKELSDVTFYNQVNGDLIPPHQLQEGSKRLPGFLWKDEYRPTRKNILDVPKPSLKVTVNKENTPKSDKTSGDISKQSKKPEDNTKKKEGRRTLGNTKLTEEK
jgi:hypothetical protein